MDNWISVNFALPVPETTVLIWLAKGRCVPACLSLDSDPNYGAYYYWWEEVRFRTADEVSHWQPLPPGPDASL